MTHFILMVRQKFHLCGERVELVLFSVADLINVHVANVHLHANQKCANAHNHVHLPYLHVNTLPSPQVCTPALLPGE